MAVTIVQEPQNFSQSGQPMVFTFSSDQAGQPNFSYIVEVSIGGNLVYTAKVLPTNGIYGFFDASEVAERYVNASAIDTSFNYDAANYNTIQLTVRENYGTPPANEANSPTNIINFYKSKSKYAFDSSNYIIDADTKFLTDFQSKQLYNFGSQRISHITSSDSFTYYLDFRNSSGTQIKLVSSAGLEVAIINYYFTYSNIETAFGVGTFTDVAYFDFYVNATGDSELYRIYIDHSDCSTFENEITFLNFLGGLDVYHFTRMKRYSRSSKPNQFKTNQGVLNDDGSFTTSDTSGQYNYQITQDESITLQTGWISEADFNVLNDQLLTSPFVLYNGSRVAITDTTAEEKYRKFDTLFNFTITIKLSTFTSAVL